MPLGMEVGLGPDNFVLDGDPAPPPQKGGQSPARNFRPMSIVAKRLDGSRWHLILGTEMGLDPGHIVLDGNPVFPPQTRKKGDRSPIFGRFL